MAVHSVATAAPSRASRISGKEDITLKVKINKCESPVTITTTMKVPDLYIDWSHEYSSGDIVKVPGFTFTLPGGFASVGVYVQVDMKDNGDQLVLTVNSSYSEFRYIADGPFFNFLFFSFL